MGWLDTEAVDRSATALPFTLALPQRTAQTSIEGVDHRQGVDRPHEHVVRHVVKRRTRRSCRRHAAVGARVPALRAAWKAATTSS